MPTKSRSPINMSKTSKFVSGKVDLSLQGRQLIGEQPVTRVVLQSHNRRFKPAPPIHLEQQSRNLIGEATHAGHAFMASLESANVPSTFLSASRSPIRKTKSGQGTIRL